MRIKEEKIKTTTNKAESSRTVTSRAEIDGAETNRAERGSKFLNGKHVGCITILAGSTFW